MYVDLHNQKQISQKFAMDMEFNYSQGTPSVGYYHPNMKHDPEHIDHFIMQTPVTKENILEFMKDVRTGKSQRLDKHQENFEIDSKHLIQDLAYGNFRTKYWTALLREYDNVVLFYHSQDYKPHDNKKALKEFNHAAKILTKRILHIQSHPGSETMDFQMRMYRYDLSKNTRSGLH